MNRYINYIFIVLAIFICAFSVYRYNEAESKLSLILNSMEFNMQNMQTHLDNCELVNHHRLTRLYYFEIDSIEKTKSRVPYYILKDELELLKTKLGSATINRGYCNMIRLYRDDITKNVYLGRDDLVESSCSSSKLVMKSGNFFVENNDIFGSKEYTMPKSKIIEIVYSKYGVNHSENKIDTITYLRNVELF